MMKKALSIILSVILLLSIVPMGTIGVGAEENDVIEIRTIADLYSINNNMSGNYKLMNDIDMTEDTAVGGDWDFMGNGWEPIGSDGIYKNIPFTGAFDGNGHEIIGMRISCNTTPSGASAIYLGLFANNEGTIKNLGIDETSKVERGSYTGGICATNSGTILNCYNKAGITSNSYSGGICSYNSGDISGCHNEGVISSGVYSGGICGNYSGSVIMNCSNSGSISSYKYSGGICGYYSGDDIINCNNTGSISSFGNATTYAGGLCGITNNIGSISNCYNRGSIIANSTNSDSTDKINEIIEVYSYAYCGGICGATSMKISNCYNTGAVSSSASSSAINTYRDSRYYYSDSNEITIPLSYSYAYTGGICGSSNEAINNCYNTANISSSVQATSNYYRKVRKTTGGYTHSGYYVYDTSPSYGKAYTYNYTGGIAGDSKKVIQNCYNIGTATYGILGRENGNSENCYYLGSSGNSNTGARALTLAQFQLEMCMPNFDFENTWVIDKTTDYKYPQLISNRQEESTPSPTIILGDVDEDDSVSIIDATCIQRYLVDIPVDPFNESAADTDGDEIVTILDVTWIQRYLVGADCPAGIGDPIS